MKTIELKERSIEGKLEYTAQLLARSCICVSFAYGPCGELGVRWSVQCMNRHNEQFDHPYIAISLADACSIAVSECIGRGWIDKTINYPEPSEPLGK